MSYISNLGNILIVLFLIVLVFNELKRGGVFVLGSLCQSVQHLTNTKFEQYCFNHSGLKIKKKFSHKMLFGLDV